MKFTALLLFLIPFILKTQTPLTLEDIWGNFSYRSQSPSDVHILKNGLHYTKIEETPSGDAELVSFDIKSNRKLQDRKSTRLNSSH